MRKDLITITDLKYHLKEHFSDLAANGGVKIVHRHGRQLVFLMAAEALPDVEVALDTVFPDTYTTPRPAPSTGSRVVMAHAPIQPEVDL